MNPQDLAIHTFTTKPWSIHECLENYARAGVGGISIWRETLEGADLAKVAKHLRDTGLKPVSLVRGGFYTGATGDERRKAVDQNLEALRECEQLGLPMMVLVCGATPGQTPAENLEQIRDGIAAILPAARDAGVRLAIEPLHPMYAANRSAVADMKTANSLCDQLDDPLVGVAVDVFHVWWDPELEAETRRCAEADRLFAYHVCDWKEPMEHMLLDRGHPGEGVLPLRYLDGIVRNAGFTGLAEVEIFSRHWWCQDQHRHLAELLEACRKTYSKN